MNGVQPIYHTGSGSGLLPGWAGVGAFSGGGRVTGSRVGDTGSSRGMTVYLRTGSPICATADVPLVDASKKVFHASRTSVNSVAAGVANSPQPLLWCLTPITGAASLCGNCQCYGSEHYCHPPAI